MALTLILIAVIDIKTAKINTSFLAGFESIY